MGFILGLGIFVIMVVIVAFITISIYCLSDDKDNIEGSVIVAMGVIIFIISITLGYFINNPEKFGYQKIEEKVIEEAEKE